MFMDYAALLDLTALISLDFSKAFDTTSFITPPQTCTA